METGRKTGLSRLFSPRWSTESHTGTVVVLVVMIILQTLVLGFDYDSVGHWFSAWGRNWINILRNNAAIGIIALGMTFVIITGGIDLAVGSTLVAIGAASMMMIVIGPKGFLGNLGLQARLHTRLPSFARSSWALSWGFDRPAHYQGPDRTFVATLGTMKILRSVTQHFMQGYNPRVPRDFLQISNLHVGGLMFMPIIYWRAIAAVLIYVSQRTVFGRQVIAVGSNERAAQLSGVNVDRVKVGAYALTGILVAIASIIQVARIGTMDFANAGSGYEMDAIAAAVVGGTSMRGGRGTIIGTVLGMLIIAVMNNLLNLFGVPPFLREAAKGLIVIAAVLFQRKDNV